MFPRYALSTGTALLGAEPGDSTTAEAHEAPVVAAVLSGKNPPLKAAAFASRMTIASAFPFHPALNCDQYLFPSFGRTGIGDSELSDLLGAFEPLVDVSYPSLSDYDVVHPSAESFACCARIPAAFPEIDEQRTAAHDNCLVVSLDDDASASARTDFVPEEDEKCSDEKRVNLPGIAFPYFHLMFPYVACAPGSVGKRVVRTAVDT